jgi:glycosyltransferase involved in cell wall biosynthesis
MKVLYDHQTFILQKYGGISRYFANLHHHLNTRPDFDCKLSVLYSKNYYIQGKSYLLPFFGDRLLKKHKRLEKWNKWYSEKQISNNEFDVFHPTYYDPYFLKKLKKPFVITVHDMIHELYPEWFAGYDSFVKYKRLVFEKADHFISISEATKKDLQAIYNIPEDRISVVHHGYKISTSSESSFTPPFSNYILFVGDRATYKNFNRFVSAVIPILNMNPDIGIICAGGGAFTIVEEELFVRKGLARVTQISANDDELKILYQKALVFVYPSLCEGFGIPILEAFANHCPAVVSDIECFREVGEDACIYFDSNSIDSISTSIETVIKSVQLAKRLKDLGDIQLNKYTMEVCAFKTAEVYKRLI